MSQLLRNEANCERTSSETVDHGQSTDESRPSPALWGAEENHGPSWLCDRLSRPSGLLDLLDLIDGPLHGRCEVDLQRVIGSITVVSEISIVDNGALVTIAGEEGGDLLVIRGTHQSSLRDLEAVGVQDRKDSSTFCWVEELVCVPGGRSGCNLRIPCQF